MYLSPFPLCYTVLEKQFLIEILSFSENATSFGPYTLLSFISWIAEVAPPCAFMATVTTLLMMEPNPGICHTALVGGEASPVLRPLPHAMVLQEATILLNCLTTW
jgi:hypothetical protein